MCSILIKGSTCRKNKKIEIFVDLNRAGHDKSVEQKISTAKEYSIHVIGLLLLNAAQIVLTPPAPRTGGPFLPFFGQAGQVDPLVGWRCCY